MSLIESGSAEMPAAKPRYELVPKYQNSATEEVLALCDLVSLSLLDWQVRVLDQLLGENDQGRWAAPEACILVPRQNGKSWLLAVRILAGLYLLPDEKLITYTAHRVDTALEVFNLVDQLARSNPITEKMIRKTIRTGGKETLEMKDGSRLKILARSRATGRGFTGDCLIMDEALELRDHGPINALLPTLATRENAQLIYASSAGDQGSVVLETVRARGHARQDQNLLLVEYAADRDANLDDHAAWIEANPGVPELISVESIQRERDRMSVDGFRQERLGIWSHEVNNSIIPGQAWKDGRLHNPTIPEVGRLGIAFDVSVDRSYASIMAAFPYSVGKIHFRTSRHDRGDSWLLDELVALSNVWNVPITYDDAGPARDIGEALKLKGIPVVPLGGRDFAASCARLVSGIMARTITHEEFEPLDQAAAAASSRSVGEGWAFARKTAIVPICPITAAAMAVWAVDHLDQNPIIRPAIY